MKSFIYGLVMVIGICFVVSAAPELIVGPATTMTSSGIKYGSPVATPTTAIISGGGQGVLGGIKINTNGSDNENVTIYDSAAASSGTVLFSGTCPGASYTCIFAFPWPIAYSNGLVAYTTSTPTFVIYYDPRGK